MLGGFHFNDRRYADDDLTLGSIDPYQVFRIFHEIALFEHETGRRADVAFMIDQSHNLKGKIEAMIQTVTVAQELFAKAAIVDQKALLDAQARCDLVGAETRLQDAFSTDVRPAIVEWRRGERSARRSARRVPRAAATWNASRPSAGTTRSPAAATRDAGTYPQTATRLLVSQLEGSKATKNRRSLRQF